MPSIAIRLDQVTKSFAGSLSPAVDGLSLDIPAGEVTVLVGPSGCGKTTTLKMVNRLLEPTAGRIEIGGVDIREPPVHELRRGIGYVIQEVGLFPHKRIVDNIATVPRLLGWPRDRVHARVNELVELLGLDSELLTRYPSELSGGQQQRVGVARALAADPPVLLMDEPYSAVDPIIRNRLQSELLRLQRRVRKTIVFVTHDIEEATRLADHLAILNVGGVLEQFGPPAELLHHPANDFVREFLGDERTLRRMSLLQVGDVSLRDGPMFPEDASPGSARARMVEDGVDWVGVHVDGLVRGWVAGTGLDGGARLGDLAVRPFSALIRQDTPLREALDLIVDARPRVAVVLDDDDRFLGVLTIDEIAKGMVD